MAIVKQTSNEVRIRTGKNCCLAVCCLLALVLFAQFAFAGRPSNLRCSISVADMKSLIDKTLAGLAYASDTEKAFLHVQHQRMSCEEYTRLFEKSDYYHDEKRRNAVATWHWHVYHAQDETGRDKTIRDLEALLGATH